MTNRFQDMLALVPTGTYYPTDSVVFPTSSSPYEFRFETTTPNRTFGIFVDGVFQGVTQSDGNGIAIVDVTLDSGAHLIDLLDEFSQSHFRAYVTVTDWATWMVAQADAITIIDNENASMRASLSLSTATSDFIEDVYGKLVSQPNDIDYVLGAYRNTLQELRQAYRLWGARDAGIRQAVSSISGIPPQEIDPELRPFWAPDDQLLDGGGDLANITVLFDDVSFPNLNARSLNFVEPSFPDNVSPLPGPFTDPPTPQPLTVTFDAGWIAGTGGDLVIDGLDENGAPITDTFLKPGVAGTVVGTMGERFAHIIDARITTLGVGGGHATIGLAESKFLTFVAARGPFSEVGGSSAHTIRHTSHIALPTLPFDFLELDGGVIVNLVGSGRFTLSGTTGFFDAVDPAEVKLPGVAPVTPAGGTVNYATRDHLWFRIDHHDVVKAILPTAPATLAAVVASINTQLLKEEQFGATPAFGSIHIVAPASINEGDTITLENVFGLSIVFEADSDNTVVAGHIPFLRTGTAQNVRDALMSSIDLAGFLINAYRHSVSTDVVVLFQALSGTAGNIAITTTIAPAGATVLGFSGGTDCLVTWQTRARVVSNGLGDVLELDAGFGSIGTGGAVQVDPNPVDAALDVMGFPQTETRLNGAHAALARVLTCNVVGTAKFPSLPTIVIHDSVASSVINVTGPFVQPSWGTPLEVWFSADYDGGEIVVDGFDPNDQPIIDLLTFQQNVVDSGVAGVGQRQTGGRAANSSGTLATIDLGTADPLNARVRVYDSVNPGASGNADQARIVIAVGLNQPLTVTYGAGLLTVSLGTDGGGAPDPTKNTGNQVVAAIEASTGFLAAPIGTGASALATAQAAANLSGGVDDGAAIQLTQVFAQTQNYSFSPKVRPGMLLRLLGGPFSGQTRRVIYVGRGVPSYPPADYQTKRGFTGDFGQQAVEVRLDSSVGASFLNAPWEVLDAFVSKGVQLFKTVTSAANALAGTHGRFQLRIRDGVQNYGVPTRVGRGIRASGTDGSVIGSVSVDGSEGLFESNTYVPHPDDFRATLRIRGSTAWAGSAFPGSATWIDSNNGLHTIYQLDPLQIGMAAPATAFLLHEWWRHGANLKPKPNTPTDWSSFVPDSGLTWDVFTQGEVVTVVANDPVGGMLTIAEPGLVNNKLDTMLVETVDAMPVFREGLPEGLEQIDVEVDLALAPTALLTSDNVTAHSRVVPDGWVLHNVNEASSVIDVWGRTNTLHLRLQADGGTVYGGGVMVELSLPRVVERKGLTLRVSFWAEQMFATGGANFRIDASFDGGNNFLVGAPVSVPFSVTDSGANGLGGGNPTQVRQDFEIPTDAVGCILQFKHAAVTSAGARIFVEKVIAHAVGAQGFFLADGTVARGETQAQFGELLYVWSPEALTVQERTGLGVPDPLTGAATVLVPGHIDRITNAHGYWERVDVSEYDPTTAVPINIQGVFDDDGWQGCTLVNMILAPLVPGRHSFVQPTIPTLIQGERLSFLAPSNAKLANISRREGIFPQAGQGGDQLYQGNFAQVLSGLANNEAGASTTDGLVVTVGTGGTFQSALAGDVFRVLDGPLAGGSAMLTRDAVGSSLSLANALGLFSNVDWEIIRRSGTPVPVPATAFPGTKATATIGAYLGANGTILITALIDGHAGDAFTVTVSNSTASNRPLSTSFDPTTGTLTVFLAARDGALLTNNNRALIIAELVNAIPGLAATYLPGNGTSALTNAEGPTSFAGAQAAPWRFIDASDIQVASVGAGDSADVSFYPEGIIPQPSAIPVFDPTTPYSLDYEALIRATSPVIDLGVNFANYLWFADAAVFRRVEPMLYEVTQTEGLLFRSDFTATLSLSSTQDQSTATMFRDNGVVRTVLPTSSWSFVDAQTVQLDSSQFDTQSIYTLEYTAVKARFSRVANFVLEYKHAAAPAGLISARWQEVDIGTPVGRPQSGLERYHQIRITLTDVVDVRDVRVKSMGFKGIRLYGATPHAPGIIPADLEP